jgi:hypothetical protein
MADLVRVTRNRQLWYLCRAWSRMDMPIPGTVGAFPSNDLKAAIPFWERLGFAPTGGDADYVIMTGWGCEVHPT